MLHYKSLPVTRKESINSNYCLLSVFSPDLAKDCLPGMFFELKAGTAVQDKRLFKPLSIFKVEQGEISFLIKIVGEGTAALANLQPGDLLNLIGALGTPFPLVEGKNVLLVSGGVGFPPLAYLQQTLAPGNKVYFVHGGSCADDVFPCDQVYTLDGSCGKQGFVTVDIAEILKDKQVDIVYSCGPVPMLKALARIVLPVLHYVSLEAYMACGVGVCHGCAVPVGETYLRVCKEGPVFNAADIIWEQL